MKPELSVVLITRHGLEPLRRTLARLRAQTIAERVEVVIVAIGGPDPDPGGAELAGLAGLRAARIEGRGADSLGEALAEGVRAARAPIVAFGEDHAFPEPEWAEATVRAHRAGAGAIAPAIVNANPGTVSSWANLLLAYGMWLAPAPAGPVEQIPGSNSSFRRSLLLELGEPLAALLSREGGLTGALRSRGCEPVLDPTVRVHHENPSRLRSTITLRVQAGRLYAGRRAAGWSARRRALFALAEPLIPPLRFAWLARKLLARGLAPAPRIVAGLGLGVLLEGAGRLAGFARGAGDAPAALVGFELERDRHLAGRDRRERAGVP